MALAIEAASHPRFLPPQLQRFVKLRALELAGLALLGAAVIMATALLTYDPLDPSASMASGRTPTNWIGGAGAAAADAGLRLLGVAAGLAPLAAAFWGLRLCLHRALGLLWLRIALLPLAAILSAAAFSALPTLPGWAARLA